jgi:hypothetical protein
MLRRTSCVHGIMNASRAALLASFLCAGCHHPAPADDRVVPPVPTDSAATEPVPPAPLIDLLYRTKARVAVSSNVANPKDYPEHLIDRRPDTAWNGKTGDLDARVLFRVPASARVRRILLTVGYDKRTKEGDLFTMNHRIKQVALAREGRAVGTFDLDPENRGPQPIELDEPGGTFELRATQTVPGSKAQWREIVVSELSVLGTAPDEELLAPAMPQVTIGSLEPPKREAGPFESVRRAAPFASVADFCARHMAAESKALERIKARSTSDFDRELEPYCRPAGPKVVKVQRLANPFVGLDVVGLLEGTAMVTRLTIKTDRGVYPTSVIFSEEAPGPGCGISSGYLIDSATVETPRPGAPILVLRATKRAAYQMASPDSFEAAAAFFIACTLDAAGAPACEEEIVGSFDGDGSWTQKSRETQVWDVHPPRWDWQRDASVDADGHIRLGPCASPRGAATTCGRRNADLLRRF